MTNGRTIDSMTSAELKIAHFDQRTEIEKQHKLVNLMNQNLTNIEAALQNALAREAEAAAAPKGPAPKKSKSKGQPQAHA